MEKNRQSPVAMIVVYQHEGLHLKSAESSIRCRYQFGTAQPLIKLVQYPSVPTMKNLSLELIRSQITDF